MQCRRSGRTAARGKAPRAAGRHHSFRRGWQGHAGRGRASDASALGDTLAPQAHGPVVLHRRWQLGPQRRYPARFVPSSAVPCASRPQRSGFWRVAVTAFATSIYAMAFGIGLAFLEVNIVVVALVIGACTLLMVTLGIMLGHALGSLVGKRAEVVDGLILIAVGIGIAYEHTAAAAGV